MTIVTIVEEEEPAAAAAYFDVAFVGGGGDTIRLLSFLLRRLVCAGVSLFVCVFSCYCCYNWIISNLGIITGLKR